MVVEPLPTPTNVCVLPLPTRLIFLILLLVAPSNDAVLCSQITALAVETFVLASVKSLLAVAGGQTVFGVAVIDPLTVTQSAPFNTIKAVAAVPVIVVAGKVGLIVNVLVALAKGFALMVIGKVSPA